MVWWKPGGRGACSTHLIDIGLGKELRPREGTPEAAAAHPTEQQLLDHFEQQVPG